MRVKTGDFLGNDKGEYIDLGLRSGFVSDPWAVALFIHVEEGDKFMTLDKEKALKLGNEIIRLANELD